MHHDFSKLLQRPGCCGVGGDVEVSDPASSDFQKNEHVNKVSGLTLIKPFCHAKSRESRTIDSRVASVDRDLASRSK